MGLSRLLLLSLCLISVALACSRINVSKSIPVESSTFYECSCAEAPDNAEIVWINPQNEAITVDESSGSDVYTVIVGRVVTLYLNKLTKAQSGVYTCVLQTSTPKVLVSLNLAAYDMLQFLAKETKQFVVKEKDSVVKCLAMGRVDPQMTWYRGDMLLESGLKYVYTQDGLLIRSVNEQDAATYTCIASEPTTGESIDLDIKVQVYTIPSIQEISVKNSTEPLVGDSLQLLCVADGNPPPEYKWFKVAEGTPTSLIEMKNFTEILNFRKVKMNESGTYRCIVYNQVGNDQRDIKIEVHEPPSIVSFSEVTVAEGSLALLVCEAAGHPTPHIELYSKNKENPDDIRIMRGELTKVGDKSRYVYVIHNVSTEHAGSYICNATNEVGRELKTTDMKVLFRPRIEQPEKESMFVWKNLSINIECEVVSNPASILKWSFIKGNQVSHVDELNEHENNTMLSLTITDDRHYGTYVCMAVNSIGRARRVVELIEGHPPSGTVKVTDCKATPTSITFKVDAPPMINGPPIIGLEYEYDLAADYGASSEHEKHVWSTNRNEYTLHQLKPNTTYRFRFMASNEVGVGPWSDFVDFNTAECTVPSTPEWTEATMMQADQPLDPSFKLSWVMPEDNGAQLEWFAIIYCWSTLSNPSTKDSTDPEEEEYDLICEEFTVPADQTTLDWTKYLSKNRTYQLHIVAHNAVGNSSDSEPLNIVTPEIMPDEDMTQAVVIVGFSALTVVVLVVVFDLLLFWTKRQGMIAKCYIRRRKQKRAAKRSRLRERKNLLKEGELTVSTGTLPRPATAYSSPTVIVGKHSSV